jgi:hypothetical protein
MLLSVTERNRMSTPAGTAQWERLSEAILAFVRPA